MGGGLNMSVFVHAQGIKTVHAGKESTQVVLLSLLDSPKNGLSFMGFYICPKLFLNIATFDIN